MHEYPLRTERRTQIVEITDLVKQAVAESGGARSACLVYVPHTTAAVTINERIDADLLDDIEDAIQRVVPDEWPWTHEDQDGPNAPSHMRSTLVGPQVLIPLRDGALALGTYQGVFFCEFDGPRDRKVYVTTLA